MTEWNNLETQQTLDAILVRLGAIGRAINQFMALFLLVAALYFLSLAFAAADEPGNGPCLHPADVVTEGARHYAKLSNAHYVEFNKKDTEKILGIINAEPPETEYFADRIIVTEESDFVSFVLIVGDCAMGAINVAPARWKQVLIQAFGEPI